MDILSYIGGFVHHTQCLQVKTEFVGEDSGEKRQFSVSPDGQQYNRDWSSFSPPSACRHATTILAGMSTCCRMFCLDGELERKRKKRRAAPKMCFTKMWVQHTHQMLVPQTGGSASSPLPSQEYQFERKIQGIQIFLLPGFFKSACLN